MRRSPLALLTALAVLLACLAAAPSTEAAEVVAKPGKPRLTVSPSRPLQGTPATFRTKLPTKVKRPVVLQRKVGSTWVKAAKGRSKPNGKVVLKRVVVPGDSQWRVVAKSVRRDGEKLRKVVTRTKQVQATLRAELVSGTPAGLSSGVESGGASVSADGRYVAFTSSSPALAPGTSGYPVEQPQVFLRDRAAGTTQLVSHRLAAPTLAGANASFWPRVSGDGQYVVFVSMSDDLVADDDEGQQDVFRWSRLTGTTTRVSVNGMGGGPDAASYDPSVSTDGSVVGFSTEADLGGDDSNGLSDVHVWRAASGEVELISTDVLGNPSNGASSSAILSADGTFVTFSSAASDLVFSDANDKRDIFRHNLVADTTALVSRGVDTGGDDHASGGRSAISADGRFVAFASLADNLVAGGPPDNGKLNVFVRDMVAGTTTLVSRRPEGGATTGHSLPPDWVSNDGARVLYTTIAPELVPGDTNGTAADALMWDRASGRSSTVISNRYGGQPNNAVFEPTLSADGHWLAFYSTATDLVPQDPTPMTDAYVWRMP